MKERHRPSERNVEKNFECFRAFCFWFFLFWSFYFIILLVFFSIFFFFDDCCLQLKQNYECDLKRRNWLIARMTQWKSMKIIPMYMIQWTPTDDIFVLFAARGSCIFTNFFLFSISIQFAFYDLKTPTMAFSTWTFGTNENTYGHVFYYVARCLCKIRFLLLRSTYKRWLMASCALRLNRKMCVRSSRLSS